MNYKVVFLFWVLWYLNYLSRTVLSPLLPAIEDALDINHAMVLNQKTVIKCGDSATSGWADRSQSGGKP
jgi:hypothetical protein